LLQIYEKEKEEISMDKQKIREQQGFIEGQESQIQILLN
jgi:hypothetical protein